MNQNQGWQKIAAVIVLTGLLAIVSVQTGQAVPIDDNDDNPETTEIVVKLDIATGVTVEEINATFNTTTLSDLLPSSGIYLLGVPANQSAKDLSKQVGADSRVFYAEPNFVSEAPEGDGRSTSAWGGADAVPFTEQYAATLIGLDSAHAFSRGKDTVVAILDTGVQLDYPGLSDRLTAARYDFIDDDADPSDASNGTDEDGDGFKDEAYGHGTHIAGIVHLVAPEAKIMPLRVLDADGRGNLFVIAEAILYAVDHGADVINLSLGTVNQSELFEEIIEDVIKKKNVVIVAAAGNLDSSNKQYPAAEEDVLAVASIGVDEKKSTFSNYGEWIDVTAPGQRIYSTFPTDGYATWSGTSMAAPFLAGQAALLRSAVPSMSAKHIGEHIVETAKSIDSVNPGYPEMLGAGRIDIGASLDILCDENGSCKQPIDPDNETGEVTGLIEQKPVNGLEGTWVIDGISYRADSDTEFKLEDGPLIVGGCVDIEYRTAAKPYVIVKLKAEKSYKCRSTPVATPSATPITTATPTPTAVHTPTPIPSSTPGTSPIPQPTTKAQGTIDNIPVNSGPGIWVIGGISYKVTADTTLDRVFTLGEQVDVFSYRTEDGTQIATRISSAKRERLIYFPLMLHQ